MVAAAVKFAAGVDVASIASRLRARMPHVNVQVDASMPQVVGIGADNSHAAWKAVDMVKDGQQVEAIFA